jgi:hypothetical protein
MGNVFQRFGLVSAAVLFFSACGGSSATDSTGSGPPPFSGTLGTAPATTPTPGSNSSAESSATTSPATTAGGTGTPTNAEAPAAGADTPLVPSTAAPDTSASQPAAAAPTPPADTSTAQATPPAPTTPDQTPPAQTPPATTGKTQVFLLFGQSNMWGVPNPEQQDLTINPKVEVLTITTCSKHGTNQWVPAQPPLHGCVGQIGTGGKGPGVGPGDYFAKTIAAAFPNDTILLVPAAVPGVSIDTFMPGQQNYTNLLSRAKMAQQRGPISGMIFHQGEADSNQPTWPTRVKTVVDRLRSDLGIGTVPFVAGELLYSPPGCCGVHNALVNKLPSMITNAAVASASGLTTVVPKSADTYGDLHFDLPAQRTFGARYGDAMLKLLGNQ